jgi:hypothetical protein
VETSSLEAGVSRYGSVSSDPARASALLRAKASAHGLELAIASKLDLTSAAIAADAWVLVLRTDSFDNPRQHGEPAVRALAAILSRAAGRSLVAYPVEAWRCASEPDALLAAAGHGRWATSALGRGAGEALRLAASDLAAAGTHSPLTSFAELLVMEAEVLESDPVF